MRRHVGLACFVALAGCRAVFGIGDVTLDDASPEAIDSRDCGSADWDGDGVPDGCDPCPMLSSPAADHDTDRDGVGDGCDPAPDQPGNTRLFWTGFDSPSTIAGWTTTGGSWAVTGGQLVQSDTAATGRFQMPGQYDNVFVQSEIDVLALGPLPQVGLCAYVGPSGFLCCDIEQPGAEDLITWNESSGITLPWGGKFQVGASFVLSDAATSSGHDCRVVQNSISVTGHLDSVEPAGAVVVHMRQVSIAYRYLWVVRL